MLFGVNGLHDAGDVNLEIVKFLNAEEKALELVGTVEANTKSKFKHSCDVIEKIFDEEFYGELEK
jgi:hypothetical protein